MTVGIVGLGLVGGSIGLALRDPERNIVGCDLDPAHEKTAKARFCVDEVLPIEEVAHADLVFIATPPRAVPDIVARLLDAKRPETVLTDCASVKTEIVSWMRAHAPEERNFVGGHPMAGHEKAGPAFASAWLFRGARWILTPMKGTAASAVRTVEKVVKLTGATPVRMDAATHDRHVAILSHVPHALAGTLVTMGAELDSTEASAGSWRDLTRVGGVDAGLWTQIFMSNRIELAKAIEDFEGQLNEIRLALENGDEALVRRFFERAKLAKAKNDT